MDAKLMPSQPADRLSTAGERGHAGDPVEPVSAEDTVGIEDLLTTLDAMELAAFACDDSGRIRSLNRSFASQCTVDSTRLLGRHYWEVRPRLDEALPECISRGPRRKRSRRGEVLDLDGAWFAYRLRTLAVGKGAQMQRMMVCTLEEISERKRNERTLQVNDRRFRAALENVNEIVTVMAPDGTIRYASPSARTALGRSPRGLVGENAFSYIHPDDVRHVREHLDQTLRAPGKARRGEYRVRHRSGKWHILETVWEAVATGSDEPEIVVSARDVTERRNAEHQHRESEDRYRSIFNAAGEGIAVRDLKGRLLDLNPAYCRMLGYRREEMIGRTIEQIVDPAWNHVIDTYWQRLTAEQEARNECVLRHKDGHPVPVEAYGIRHVYRGRPAVLAFVRDISERRQAEIFRQQDAEALRRTLEETVTAISLALDKRDPYTGGHERRVAALSLRIAQELGMDKQGCEGAFLGGMVHDVGKIHIPLEILNRPGRLSQAEFAIIKSHPEVGFDILNGVHFDWPIAEIALQHHERLDGSGYPFGLQDKDILPEAKILAVADVVEAMSSHRPYRPGLGIEAALTEVQSHRGTGFDADAVDACVHLFHHSQFSFP